MTRLPVFNLGEFENSAGASREKHCEDLDKFCSKIGFLLVENHGVPDHVIESQWTAVEQFFSQKTEDKNRVSVPYPGYPYGWIGPNKEALAASKGEKTPPDLKESFNGGPIATPAKKLTTIGHTNSVINPQFGQRFRASKRRGRNIISRLKNLQLKLCQHLLKH